MLDAIPPAQPWTVQEIAAQVQRAGFETTYATVQQFSYLYRKNRRSATMEQRGMTKVFKFDEPAPAEFWT